MKVYLSGAINGCTDAECKDWRKMVTARLGPEIFTIDPMRHDYRGMEQEKYREIVETDKADIEDSDIVLVYYEKPSVGTSMEILWAWLREIPIILVATEGVSISPWLAYHVTKIAYSFDDAVAWIQQFVRDANEVRA